MGVYGKGDLNRLNDSAITVPITLQNDLENSENSLLMQINWVSVSKVNERTYKPDIGLWVVDLGKKK